MRIITVNGDRLRGMANDPSYAWISSIRGLKNAPSAKSPCRSCGSNTKAWDPPDVDWVALSKRELFKADMLAFKNQLQAQLLRVRLPGVSFDI